MPYRVLSIAALILLSASPGVALPAEAYQNCAALSKTKPAEALALAEAALAAHKTPEAKHCRALSLFSLERYAEAAEALEEVFTQTPPQDLVLSVNLLRQAARAWHLAKDNGTALKRFTRATEILQATRKPSALTNRLLAETLLERGALYQATGDTLAALQDMDYAVSLKLLGERAHIARARLLMEMQQSTLALQDTEAALRYSPQNTEAQRLLKEIVSLSATK